MTDKANLSGSYIFVYRVYNVVFPGEYLILQYPIQSVSFMLPKKKQEHQTSIKKKSVPQENECKQIRIIRLCT